MRSNFDKAFLYVLGNEGGFSNHKSDRGGATRYGITIGTLQAWRGGDECYPSDVAKLSMDEAKEIYQSWYWNSLGLDHVPEEIATVMFDAAILFGPPTAARQAQLVLSQMGFDQIKVDGVVGQKTRDCLTKVDKRYFVLGFRDRLGKLIEEIILRDPKQKTFQKGWTNRLDRMVLLIA